MIQQIDHILMVVPDLDAARDFWRTAGCPILWDGRWHDPRATVSLFGVSVGPLNLEIIAPEGRSLFGLPEGAFGVASVAFDPGGSDDTVRSLRAAGFRVPDPQPWHAGKTFVSTIPDAALPAGGINTALGLTLPGLIAFLSEYLPPHRHRGRTRPESPVQFVELVVRQPDPGEVVAVYERVLGVRAAPAGGDFLLPLSDTPLRLARGHGLDVVLSARSVTVPMDALSAAVPALRWSCGSGSSGA